MSQRPHMMPLSTSSVTLPPSITLTLISLEEPSQTEDRLLLKLKTFFQALNQVLVDGQVNKVKPILSELAVTMIEFLRLCESGYQALEETQNWAHKAMVDTLWLVGDYEGAVRANGVV